MKPQNIFVEPVQEGFRVRLGDFDVSKALSERAAANISFLHTATIGGTIRFAAPELLNENTEIALWNASEAADMLSAGLVILELIRPGTVQNRPLAEIALPINIPALRPSIVAALRGLLEVVEQMSNPNPSKRPTAERLLGHPIFNGKPLEIALAAPSYWRGLNSIEARVDVTAQLGDRIEALMNSSSVWSNQANLNYVRLGRSGQHCLVELVNLVQLHKGYRVLKVERIENIALWQRYSLQRSQIHSAMLSDQAKGLPITRTKLECDVEWLRELTELNEVGNEVLLFHGTKPGVVDIIVKEGFDQRVASAGIFGRGIYLAERKQKRRLLHTNKRRNILHVHCSCKSRCTIHPRRQRKHNAS